MSDKREADYRKLIKHLDIKAEEFLMIGNSLKSDALPVLNIGGHAIHVPYHITWEHETIETRIEHDNFRQAECIRDVLQLL
jgi:putative hydrolase of the HAD superfamily